MNTTSKISTGWLGPLLGRGMSGTDRLAALVRLALRTFAVVAVAYLGTSYFISNRIQTQGQLGSLAISTSDISNDMLEMRRNEKDFLDRKTQDELDKHKRHHELTMASIGQALANPTASAEDIEALQSLRQQVENYNKAFQTVAQRQLELGVDENAGLQGKLRTAAHNAEQAITSAGNNQLYATLLNLRRHEKDFILRAPEGKGEQYLAQFDKRMSQMVFEVADSKLDFGLRSSINNSLKAYEQGFHEFTAGTFALFKALEQGRDAAHKAEKPIPTIVQRAAQRRSDAVSASQLTLGSSAVGLIAVLAGLAYLLWSAMRAADATLAERLAAQQKAEAENEQLNNSVISILQAVHQLSQRDLTVRAPVTTDVIGTVSDSINALAGETSKVLQGVTQIADQVAQATGKVKSQADLVSQTAEEERLGVTDMINSLADATQTMNQVAALAEQSNHSAESATRATDTALETVNGTVKGMESIRETIAETEKRIKRLGERSQEISGIVNLINTIAERTHVLALNAAMQAAVAGEAGRGFAVVAEEVQRLAESSRNATQQIGTLVNNIQLETNETINTVNRTISQVVQGSEQAQRAGEQMRTTQEMTGNLVAQVRRIALASEQQKEMSVNLLESVQRIGQSAERTAQQIAAQNQETQSLQASARQLVDSVNVFKLPQLAV